MILIYNPETDKFLFAPVKYTGDKDNLEDIIKDCNKRVPLVKALRIKLARAINILDVNLGKAEFYLTHYFQKQFERDIYLEELKKAKLIPHERDGIDINHHLSGYVEFFDDIKNFIENLEKLDVEELKNDERMKKSKDTSYRYHEHMEDSTSELVEK